MKGTLAWIIFSLTVAVCLLWVGFGVRDDLREDTVFHDIVSERLDYAEDPDEEVHIGVAGDFAVHQDILLGARLAASIINADGGILGRKIVLDERDDQGTVDESLAVAQEFASNPQIGFVIGHTHFGLSNGVAQNYEFYGVLRISPNTSGNTQSGFKLLFENGIDPKQTGKAVLDVAVQNNWRKLGLIYTKSKRAMQHARRFESMANKEGIKIPLAFAFKGRGSGISRHMVRWKRELDLDAIVLAIDQTNVAGIISACRAIGIECPFILLGEYAKLPKRDNGLGTVYVMEPLRNDPAYAELAKDYEAMNKEPMTTDALLGFDALNILKQAIVKADSFVPSKVAETLKDTSVDNSMSGTTNFDDSGSAVRQPPHFSPF